MLLSFQMLPEQPARELLEAGALADELGYHACYSADEIYHKDAWLLFAALAQRTERIRLGPCVAPIYMREPTYVAQLAATLDELSSGRAEVVFGIGNIAMLEQYGVEWRGTRPIARLREAHRVMRTVLGNETTTVTVNVTQTATDGSADYANTSGNLTFLGKLNNGGVGETSHTIHIPLHPDTVNEGDEAFTVTLSANTNSTLGAPNPATVTVVDDDTSGTLEFSSQRYDVNETGDHARITVNRVGGSAGPVSWPGMGNFSPVP